MATPNAKCDGCNKTKTLKPFWIFTDPEYWWVNRGNLIMLCQNCHTARATLRFQEPEKLPRWWFLAQAFADYIPPDEPPTELKLRQQSLL